MKKNKTSLTGITKILYRAVAFAFIGYAVSRHLGIDANTATAVSAGGSLVIAKLASLVNINI